MVILVWCVFEAKGTGREVSRVHQRTLRAVVFRNKAVRNQLAIKARKNETKNLVMAGIGCPMRLNCSQVTNP